MAERRDDLQTWAEQWLTKADWRCDGALSLAALSGDAGFRRYYRLNTTPPLLAVDAPPATEDSAAFVRIANFLREQGVHTPDVLAVDLAAGFLLVEDFGDELLLDSLSADTVELLYGEALLSLLRLQQSPFDGALARAYDGARLGAEMQLFSDWFVPQLLGYSLSAEEQTLVSDTFAQLQTAALEQPQVLVHRDFHSRNLMLREGGAPGVVDFQDAVWGPLTYDLVSLLRDCYIRWPREKVEHWALTYGDMAVDAGVMSAVPRAQFLRWFDWMGLQRHIKVLGIFARLYLRDGKTGYLKDLPLVMRYTLEVTESYPELEPFNRWFRTQLLPLAEQQDWYRDYQSAGDSQ